MTPPKSPAAVKITTLEPLAKLSPGRSYRIRVMKDNRLGQPLHAIAAMRCENREEIHWLSVGFPCPAETSRLMRTGFSLPDSTENPLVLGVMEELMRNGCAMGLDS